MVRIRRLLRILHRDFGYFIVGMTVVYGLSGIFLNHQHDFNPNYNIIITDFNAKLPEKSTWTNDEIKQVLKLAHQDVVYKKHYKTTKGTSKYLLKMGKR